MLQHSPKFGSILNPAECGRFGRSWFGVGGPGQQIPNDYTMKLVVWWSGGLAIRRSDNKQKNNKQKQNKKHKTKKGANKKNFKTVLGSTLGNNFVSCISGNQFKSKLQNKKTKTKSTYIYIYLKLSKT